VIQRVPWPTTAGRSSGDETLPNVRPLTPRKTEVEALVVALDESTSTPRSFPAVWSIWPNFDFRGREDVRAALQTVFSIYAGSDGPRSAAATTAAIAELGAVDDDQKGIWQTVLSLPTESVLLAASCIPVRTNFRSKPRTNFASEHNVRDPSKFGRLGSL